MTTRQHPLFRLLAHTKQHRTQVALATLCSLLNKFFDIAPPVLIGMAVDVVISQEDSFIAQWGITDPLKQLYLLAGLTVLVWLLESAFEYGLEILWRNLAQTIQHEFRVEAYDHVQGLELAYFEDRSTGGLLSILNDDINQLERFLDGGANDLIQIAFTVIAIGGLFVWSAPSIAWMTLLPMPIVVWGALYFQKKLAPRYAEVRERVSLLNGKLANNLSGIATIKSFTTEEHETERIRQESQAYRESNRQAIVLSSAFVPLIRIVILAGFTAILVFGGQLVLSGGLNVGLYSVMIFMTQRLLWPLTTLGNTLDLYQRAMASTARVLDLLDTESTIIDGSLKLPIPDIRGEITFSNVSFVYDSEGFHNFVPAAIHNLSLHIPAGRTVAIVGATGAGKSTLVKLILRFYDVNSGHITLDTLDVRDLRMANLRQAIGFVSQDVFLFHGTVRENIAYGCFEASEAEIIEAAQTAEAHAFIMELPQGYDTVVGERGQKLSGGQRQRLSIARAVLKNPPVLILDEATSAVDNETEAAIQRSMERIAIGRTTIMIAHRLSTIRNAHCIFVLEKGQLKENGTHDELVAQNGIYAGLWQVQTGAIQ